MAAAHAAVDEAVEILRAGRTRRHTRIDKATNDFLTEVDLASEATLKRARLPRRPRSASTAKRAAARAWSLGWFGSLIRSTGRSITPPDRRCAV